MSRRAALLGDGDLDRDLPVGGGEDLVEVVVEPHHGEGLLHPAVDLLEDGGAQGGRW
jgi:hypothetical protein